MRKLKPIILPVLLVLILGIQLYAYFNGTINYAFLGVVFALTPAAIGVYIPTYLIRSILNILNG